LKYAAAAEKDPSVMSSCSLGTLNRLLTSVSWSGRFAKFAYTPESVRSANEVPRKRAKKAVMMRDREKPIVEVAQEEAM